MHQANFFESFGGETSPQNIEGAQFASSSDNSLQPSLPTNAGLSSTLSQHNEGSVTHPRTNRPDDATMGTEQTGLRFPVPAHWFRKDKEELLKVLGLLPKEQLLTALAYLYCTLPGQARRSHEPLGVVLPLDKALFSYTTDIEPDYTIKDLADHLKITTAAVTKRVRKLVKDERLAARYSKPLLFDEAEARLIIGRRPPKK